MARREPMATTSATASLQRRTLGVFTTNIVVLAIGYVGSIILARFLGADGRGLVAVILTATAVLAGLGGVGTHEAATYYASRRARRRPYVLGNGLAHAAGLLVISLVAAYLLMGALQRHVAPHYDRRIWLLAGLLVPSYYLYELVTSMLSAEGAFAFRNRLNVTARISTTAATLAIVGWLGWGVPGALVASMPALLVPVAGGMRLLARNGIALSRTVHSASLRYGARVQVGSLLTFLNARFDVLVLSAFAPLAVVGSYAVAQLVAELVLLFPMSLGYVLRAQVASGRQNDSLSGAAMRLNGTLVGICVALVLLAGPATIIYGYGPGFRSALVPFLILLPGMWFLSTGGLVQNALSGRGRPGLSSLLAGGEVVITVGLDFALIPRYGAVGGAVASVCAYAFYGIASVATIARLDAVPARTLLFASRSELRSFVTTLRSRG
jgi:O-antigen/teichoic acid export membrane protein